MIRTTALRPLLIIITLCGLAAAETKAPLPNIVVFISDDHNMLDPGLWGSTTIHSPNLTKSAAEGMKSTHAYC